MIGNGRNNSLRLCLLQLNLLWKIRNKLKRGQRNLKIIIGNFSSYQMETQALSWTEESHVVWQRVGAKCIKDKNDKTPSNCGQIAKEYILSKETNGAFQFTYKGKDAPKPERVCRQKKASFIIC